MKRRILMVVGSVLVAGAVALPVANALTGPTQFTQANLISDIPGVARITDTNLVNPWGLAALPGGPLWVADNGADLSTVYTGGVNGSIPRIQGLRVKIPGGAPTGAVDNTTSGFVVKSSNGSGPAQFIFDSENGFITGWNFDVSGNRAQVGFNGGTAAVYKGLAMASSAGAEHLYATNFRAGTVDVFNSNFKKVTLSGGGFTDPNLPTGYAPFGIAFLDSHLYVSYALQDGQKHDDVAGKGHGFVDVYNTGGKLLRRLISQGALNSPWGMVLAPSSFGTFAGDLLVGNFGDGTIHAYNATDGAPRGQLTNTDGNPIAINGLWDLFPGNGSFGATSSLVFSAGIGDESHGLLGELTSAG